MASAANPSPHATAANSQRRPQPRRALLSPFRAAGRQLTRLDLAPQILKLVTQVERRLITALRIFLQAAPDDAPEVTRQAGARLGHRHRVVTQDRRDQLRLIGPGERP